ncbi:hypothetical protein Taro_036960 [Colocasia esculenta]|uniref:Uncharacterized protein n=1 Tax=Colocasia esculenta TaxID=4460 RepID=A0A843W8B4_COLES|nr:hypothetical protein [Colocasia esculenta]
MSGVRGGSACGPLTLWRSEVAVLAVRRRSHLVVRWSRQDCSSLISVVAVLPQSLRCAVVLAGAFWRVFPEQCLGGSGGGSPRTCLRCFYSYAYCSVLSDDLCCLVVGSCILVKVLPKIALCRFWWRFFPRVLCVCFGPLLCCPCGLKCAVWLGCVLARCAERCFRCVPDSVGFCGSLVCGPTLVGGPGVALFSSTTL